jgi:hypothetical protein
MEWSCPATVETRDLGSQGNRFPFGGFESLGKSFASAPFTDELDEIGDLALDRIELERLGQIDADRLGRFQL